MQGAQHTGDSEHSSIFAGALQHSSSLFTSKRVGYSLAGAFVFVGAAVALNSGVAGQENGVGGAVQRSTIQTSSESTVEPESSAGDAADGNSTSTGSTSNTSSTNVQLNVNGQPIDVPENGSVQQTIPTSDGSGQSSVNVNASKNDSSSSLNVNISSSSDSSGTGFSSSASSTVVMQNGGTTFVSSN